jgi:hypothetical protein
MRSSDFESGCSFCGGFCEMAAVASEIRETSKSKHFDFMANTFRIGQSADWLLLSALELLLL